MNCGKNITMRFLDLENGLSTSFLKPAKQRRYKLLLGFEPRQQGQAQAVASTLSTPPWGKLVIKLSPLTGEADQKRCLW